MIERLQRWITAAIVVAGLAWALVFTTTGRPLVALAGVLVLLFGHAVVLAVELALMQAGSRGSGSGHVPWADLMAAWLAEVGCAPRVFCWRQPFRTHAWPDELVGAERRRGLLLVHGFLCNRGVWNGWYPRLKAAGVPFIGLSLEPAFGDIDDYVGQIEAAVAQLTTSTGVPPVVVAHSMGGLAVRAWLSQAGEYSFRRVHRVVTLATPHHGTALVKFTPCMNVQQMAFRSEWLRQLAARESAHAMERFVCIYSRCDNVVFPVHSTWLEGADRVELRRCAHIQMVDRPEVHAIVRRMLEETAEDADEASITDRRSVTRDRLTLV